MLNLKKSYHEFLRSKKDPRKDLKYYYELAFAVSLTACFAFFLSR